MGTNYKPLSCEERTMSPLRLELGCTQRVIARSLQWAPSLRNRELKRNGWISDDGFPEARPSCASRDAMGGTPASGTSEDGASRESIHRLASSRAGMLGESGACAVPARAG